MNPGQLSRTAALLLCLPLGSALAQPNSGTNVVEERVTYENGAVKVCGEGDGLAPCRDANGQTYAEEARGPSMASESDGVMKRCLPMIRLRSPSPSDAAPKSGAPAPIIRS